MRRTLFQFVLLAAVSSALASRVMANAWELMIQLTGPSTGFRVCETATGNVIGTYPASSTFTVDFNNTGGATVSLQPNVQYTLTFTGWSKACYIQGDMPPNQTNYDDTWAVNSNTNSVTHVSGPNLQVVSGFPGATCATPPNPPGLVLSVDNMSFVGDKVIYSLRGTASGGVGTYTFSWSNANMTTNPNTNPSLAGRAILRSQSVTVSCTVSCSSGSTTKSMVLEFSR